MMQPAAVPARNRGFTVIELMVTLAILAIMMGLGVPSFRAFINGQRVKSATSELMTTLVIARSEAIKRNTPVAVTPTEASNWAKGWVAAVTATATQVHNQAEIQNITATTYTDATCSTSGSVATISYANTGRPASASCFKFEAPSSSTIRCVSVDLTGIPSSKTWNSTLNRCQ